MSQQQHVSFRSNRKPALRDDVSVSSMEKGSRQFAQTRGIGHGRSFSNMRPPSFPLYPGTECTETGRQEGLMSALTCRLDWVVFFISEIVLRTTDFVIDIWICLA